MALVCTQRPEQAVVVRALLYFVNKMFTILHFIIPSLKARDFLVVYMNDLLTSFLILYTPLLSVITL